VAEVKHGPHSVSLPRLSCNKRIGLRGSADNLQMSAGVSVELPSVVEEYVLFATVPAYFLLATLSILIVRKCSRPKSQARHKFSRRQQLNIYLHRVGILDAIDLFQTLLSFVSCVVYVLETYDVGRDSDIFNLIEYTVSLFFFLDYVLRFYLHQDKLKYVWSFFAIVDVLTLVPVLVKLFAARSSQTPILLRSIRVVKLLRIMRSIRMLRAVPGDGLKREVFLLASTAGTLIFTAAGFYQLVETSVELDCCGDFGMPFHEALYYMTIEVMGRPRITPEGELGFLSLIFIVILSVILIPRQLAALFQVLQRDPSVLVRSYNRSHESHIVVMGFVDSVVLNLVLYETFHEDRGIVNAFDIVILSTDALDRDIERLIQHPLYAGSVQFLQGTPRNDEDLERAKVHEAEAILILANKYPVDPRWEDAKITSIVLAVKAFKNAMLHREKGFTGNKKVRVLAQVHALETRDRIMQMPGWNSDLDICLSVRELSAAMLTLSSLFPGLATMLLNLVSHTAQAPNDSLSQDWFKDYQSGSTQEIYHCKLTGESPLLQKTLMRATESMLAHGMLVVGIQRAFVGRRGFELVLFPGDDQPLKANDRIFVVARNVVELVDAVKGRPCQGRNSRFRKVSRDDSGNITFHELGESPLVRAAATAGCFFRWTRWNRGAGAYSLKRARTISVASNTSDVKCVEGQRSDQCITFEVSFDAAVAQLGLEILWQSWPTVVVTKLGGASDRRGILPGDMLTAMNGVGTFGKDRAELLPHLSARPLLLSVHRPRRHYGEDGSTGIGKPAVQKASASASVNDSGRHAAHVGECSRTDQVQEPSLKPSESRLELLEADVRALRSRLCSDESPVRIRLTRTRGLSSSSSWDMFMNERPDSEACSTQLPQLREHIIIAGGELADLVLIVSMLLRDSLDRNVVLLNRVEEETRKQREWKQLVGHERIHFVEDIAEDLDIVNVDQAKAVIVLPAAGGAFNRSAFGGDPSQSRDHRRILDAETILMTGIFAKRPCQGRKVRGVWTVTQLLQESTLSRFFGMNPDARGGTSKLDPRWLGPPPLNMNPMFAAGHIVSASTLDRFLVESYFNPHVFDIINHVFGLPRLTTFPDEDNIGNERSKRDFVASRFCAFQIPLNSGVLENVDPNTYGDLCNHLLGSTKPLLPLGLFRYPGEHLSCYSRLVSLAAVGELDLRREPGEESLPYVWTNPPQDTAMRHDDLVFVLGER